LFVFVDLTDPGGEGQDTITGHSKNQAGCSDDCNAGTLRKAVSVIERWCEKIGFTKIKPSTAMMVMKTLGPLPNARA